MTGSDDHVLVRVTSPTASSRFREKTLEFQPHLADDLDTLRDLLRRRGDPHAGPPHLLDPVNTVYRPSPTRRQRDQRRVFVSRIG